MKISKGFTLIELLVVIAIIALLMALAAPSFKLQLQSSAITGGVNSFLADIRFARSEAIRRGGGVVMCRSDSPEAANATCSSGAGNGWVSGWIIFVDKNNNGARDYNASSTLDDNILRIQSPITNLDTIAEGGTAGTKFQFTGTGRLVGTGNTESLTFGGTQFASKIKRVVCVSIGGRARIAGDGSTSCGANGL